MKDFAILSLKLIFFILTSLQELWQSICSRIYFALAIINLEMILKELLGSTGLSKAQTLYIHEATKVLMIYKDGHFVFATFEIMTLYL